uniref:Gypsy retrotransposon integrase-like protein 1 n=1 Tax=Oreochromis niloticus TaxID=8128 RepID=A0A669C557_ORENI
MQTSLVQHDIDTGDARPIRLRPRRLPLAKRAAAEQKIKEMAEAGIIEPSNSPWAAPAVLVRKKDGTWRFCVDYRLLNSITRKDSYSLPRIDDALDDIAGSCWFSSLDLRSGYWQVELTPEARPKTAFSIGQGLWQFKVMPFGLCNAPATFERLMERVLADIPRDRCVVYLDDLLVHATDFEKALANLTAVFHAIRQAGLRLHPKKCHLFRKETTFLGHVVSGAGVSTDPAKVAAVKDWPIPGNTAELRSFLGLASYYRRFVKDFATIASPLHQLTQKGREFHWSEDCAVAFDRLRSALVEAPVLAYPDLQLPFVVDTDASNTGVGAVLSQEGPEGERVISYYSRSLSRPERNYCVTRRELLAIILGLRHFRPYLYGKKFLLRTDHASLTWLLSFKELEGQLARWLETLQDYHFEVRHRAGRLHTNADALSRRPCEEKQCRYCQRLEDREGMTSVIASPQGGHENDSVPGGHCSSLQVQSTAGDTEGLEAMDPQRLQHDQNQDPALSRVQCWIGAGQRPSWPEVSALDLETKALYSQWANLTSRNGLLYRRWQAPGGHREVFQLLVPQQLRSRVLQLVHGVAGAGHFGVTKTLRRLRSRFYWPGCRQDVELHVHRCDACTAQKGPSQRSHAPLQQYQVGAPMERVGVDILGPFPTTDQGNRYVLVAMDYFTKWPEAYAVPDQSAVTTAERLVNEMFCRFGVPEELHSDQGRNFEAAVFKEVCQRLGIRKTRTTPLHPQSDGLVERFNHTLATQLAILTSRQQRDWDQHLPLVLMAYRSAVQKSTKCTPAALMFGHELRTPVDLVFGSPPEPEVCGDPGLGYLHNLLARLREVHQLTRQALRDAGSRQKRAYDTRCKGEGLLPGQHVWVYSPERKKGLSPKLMSQWVGPCTVLERLSDVVYRVRLVKRNRVVVLHRDRLAPYQPLSPPREEPGSQLQLQAPNLASEAAGGPTERPQRRRRLPQHLRDFAMDVPVAGDS